LAEQIVNLTKNITQHIATAKQNLFQNESHFLDGRLTTSYMYSTRAKRRINMLQLNHWTEKASSA